MIKIYLAGPWFYGDQPEKLSKVEKCLDEYEQTDVFSPRREMLLSANASHEMRKKTFAMNIEGIVNADMIVALVDDSDKGTLFECGVAYAHNIPILYYCETAKKKPFNLMLAESCTKLGHVTSVEELDKRMKEIFEKGIENMNAERFEGEIQ